MEKTTKNINGYTYADLALDMINLLNGSLDLEELNEIKIDIMTAKAVALLEAQESKAAYNKNRPRKSTAKGASEATQANVDKITPLLKNGKETAITGAEINAKLGTNFNPLQIANALRFVKDVDTVKVVRETTNGKGLKAERFYTGYFIEPGIDAKKAAEAAKEQG